MPKPIHPFDMYELLKTAKAKRQWTHQWRDPRTKAYFYDIAGQIYQETTDIPPEFHPSHYGNISGWTQEQIDNCMKPNTHRI